MAKRAPLIRVKKKAPRKSRLQQSIMDGKFMGGEPSVNANTSMIEMIEVLNWYNYMTDSKTVIEWFKEHLSTTQKKHIATIEDKFINRTLAVIARLIDNGNEVPQSYKDKLDLHISELMKREKKVEEILTKEEPKIKESKGDLAIADFEEALDKLDSEFSSYEYLNSNEIPKMYCTQINDYYTRVRDELELALTKGDKDVVEAYSSSKKKDIKAMFDFVNALIDGVSRYSDNKAKVRKPRAAKKKSVDDITKHMKFEAENAEFQIMSIDPSRILKASELYVFNTKYHTLTRFVAKNAEKLQIHRSSITNFDPELTVSKRIGRKSKEAINIVLNGGQVQKKNVFDITNSAFIKVPERINENVVLLTAK